MQSRQIGARFAITANSLWERACPRRGRHSQHQHWMTASFREQARSHSLISLTHES